jgi:dihydroflavonol-4-reductase
MTDNTHIFVTGATGFLGHNLIPLLIANGYCVRALVRPTSQWQYLADLGVDLAWGDVRDPLCLDEAMRDCRVVVHAAGLFRFWGRDEDFYSTNVQGTQHVLHAAQRAGVARLIHVSTIAVIGHPKPGAVIDETYPCQPCDSYMRSKLDGEGLALEHHRRHGLPVIVLRAGAFYGPWGRYAFNRLFFEDPFKGLPILVHGGRHVTFPIYVPDLSHVIHTALTKGQPGEIYNVSGPSMTHREVNATTSKILGRTPHWIHVPPPLILAFARAWTALSRFTRREPYYPINMAPYVFGDWVVDSGKAMRELDLRPTPFEEGARATIAWYQDSGILKRIAENS